MDMDLDLFLQIKKFFRHDFELGIQRPYYVQTVEADPSRFTQLNQARDQGYEIRMQPSEHLAPQYLLTGKINQERLTKQHMRDGEYRPGRMILQFPDGRYQVWLRFRVQLTRPDKIKLLKMLGVSGRVSMTPWSDVPGYGCELKEIDTYTAPRRPNRSDR